MSDAELLKCLEQFTSRDEKSAQAAFNRLAEGSRGFLRSCLRKFGLRDEEAIADIAQNSLLRVWDYRARYQVRDVSAWYGWLKRIARNCYVDWMRRLPCEPRVEDTDAGAIFLATSDWVEPGLLYDQANVEFLGLNETLSPETHERQLLAAQFYYVEGLSVERARRLLGPGPPDEPPLTAERLEEWLTDPGVLRLLAYQTFYYSNDRLAGFLLNLPEPMEPEALDTLRDRAAAAASEPPPEIGWTWEEVKVLLWRYRHGLSVEKILNREDWGPHNREGLEALLLESTRRFPFEKERERLLDCLGARGCEALRTAQLWQRLAFQYYFYDDLSFADVRERLEPAARGLHEFQKNSLHSWLYNGLLLKRLAKRVKRILRGEEGGDDE